MGASMVSGVHYGSIGLENAQQQTGEGCLDLFFRIGLIFENAMQNLLNAIASCLSYLHSTCFTRQPKITEPTQVRGELDQRERRLTPQMPVVEEAAVRQPVELHPEVIPIHVYTGGDRCPEPVTKREREFVLYNLLVRMWHSIEARTFDNSESNLILTSVADGLMFEKSTRNILKDPLETGFSSEDYFDELEFYLPERTAGIGDCLDEVESISSGSNALSACIIEVGVLRTPTSIMQALKHFIWEQCIKRLHY